MGSDDTYPVEYDPMEEFVSKFRPKEIIIEPHKPKEYFGYDDFLPSVLLTQV